MSDKNTPEERMQAALGDESLAIFMRDLSRFNDAFCDMMVSGRDFTLKLEVRGAGHKLNHCRVSHDSFTRPKNGNDNGEPDKRDIGD